MKFLLWKPFGITSNYFIDELKTKHNYTKICYAGRLDPLAQGEMLILTDNDVKTMTSNLKHNKTYTFDLILGLSTSSSDIAGNIIAEEHIINYDETYINNKLIEFIKQYTIQVYPLVSSYIIKHEIFGRKPLWWFAKNNVDLDLDLDIPRKNITIFDYKIFNIATLSDNDLYTNAINRLETITNNKTINDLCIDNYINVYKNKLSSESVSKSKIKLSMELTVSTGFYIRQFCNDFGKYINIPSIAFDITRTKIA